MTKDNAKETPPTGRVAGLITRHPWRVVIAGFLVSVVAIVLGGPVVGLLYGGGFKDPRSESSIATDRLTDATGVDADSNVVALVRVNGGVDSPAGRAEVARIRDVLRADPAVGGVRDALSQIDPGLVSQDGRSTYLVAVLKKATEKSYSDTAARIQ